MIYKSSLWLSRSRSSHQRCSIKKGVLRNVAKFTQKHLCQNLFFNRVASLRPAILLRKTLWHRCFPVNFVKYLRTPFLQNTSGRLLPTFLRFLGCNLLDFWSVKIQMFFLPLKKLSFN